MVMLSYLLTQEIEKSTAGLEMTTTGLMHDLDRICLQSQCLAKDVQISRLSKPTAAQTEILQALEIDLPEATCVPSTIRPTKS